MSNGTFSEVSAQLNLYAPRYANNKPCSRVAPDLRGIATVSRETTLVKIDFPSEKGSALTGKNLLPLGANSFLLETSFQKGVGVQGSKQKVPKVASLVKTCSKFAMCIRLKIMIYIVREAKICV